MRHSRRIKVAVIGDGNVGKTSICYRLVDDQFQCAYVPTIFETNVHLMEIDGTEYELQIIDTAGQEAYDQLRQTLVYHQNPDVYIVCYAVDDAATLRNAKSTWWPELQKNSPGKPVILVGNKTDLRNTRDTTQMLSHIDGLELKNEMGAVAFFECSAKSTTGRQGISLIFETAITSAATAAASTSQANSTECCCVIS